MLVIADAERAAAVGGVMGGRDSEIHAGTTRMVLESAYFHPPSVRRTSKALGLKTEASIRFERGGDIAAPPAGIARAAALFEQIGAGGAIGPLIDRYPSPRPAQQVKLRRRSRIARLLGTGGARGRRAAPARAARVRCPTATSDGWTVTVPTCRVDVAREADLIEEVGRHFGFDRIPAAFPALAAPQPPPDPAIARERILRQLLTASGFSEAMTFAFVEREAALPFCRRERAGGDRQSAVGEVRGAAAVAAAGPARLLRPTTAGARRKDIRLFETGSRFSPAAGEGRAAALAWCGAADGPHWSAARAAVDFFDVKGVVERVCATFGVHAEFVGR